MEINATLEAERAVYSYLDNWEAQLVDAVREKIVSLTDRLEATVRAEAPVGKTGHLQSSIHSLVRESSHRIVGIVTASAPYVGVIEFGIHKQISVRSHERRLAQVFGRDVAPEEIFIDPYMRAANVEATFFMQMALDSIEGEIAAELREVIDEKSGALGEL